MEKQIRNIMIAFISLVNERSVANPVVYPDIEGKPYTAIQTNEAAVVAVERMFPERPLSELFCIVSKEVQEGLAPVPAGETPCTHQQFFERRLLQEYPALFGHFHYFSYTDSLDDMDNNLLDVTNIARGILAYKNRYPDDKIIVHADMTGGMRHVSMMMLSVMQMLKYSGIVIGEVLYSDPRQQRVYKATQIQRMFTLINGADEFVKFGSVNAIKEYFRNKEVSPQLQKLLDAMERFSQAIHLCQTNSMQPVLQQLRVAINEFQNCDKKDLQEQLFNGLLATIRREYGKLLAEDASILDIIRWCLKNEFWQQTLTFCTEWLPIYLVEHRLAYTDDVDLQKFCQKEGLNMARNWQQDFIITCNKTKIAAQRISAETGVVISDKNMRLLLQHLADHVISGDKAIKLAAIYPRLQRFLKEYKDGKKMYNYGRNHLDEFNVFSSQYVYFYEVLQILYGVRKATGTYRDTFAEFITKMPYNKIMSQVATLPKTVLSRWLPEPPKNIETVPPVEYEMDVTPLTLAKGKEQSWQNRQQEYRRMYQTKALQSKLDYYDMIGVLRSYFDIRQKRNEINHANADEKISLEELRLYIYAYLNQLEALA